MAVGAGGLAETLRRELAPQGTLEELLVDRVVQAVARLRRIASAGENTPLGAEPLPEEARAESTLFHALSALESLRSRRGAAWGRSAPANLARLVEVDQREFESPDDFDEREEAFDFEPPTPPEAEAEGIRCQDHLVYDTKVSADSPVVRGTWVTVSQVASLVVDGWSWAEILRSHPELTEMDIRACLAYAIQEESGGPLL